MENKSPKELNAKEIKKIEAPEYAFSEKVYTIRGQKIMLDYDLAKIYGYTTSAFNQQVMRNAKKFEGEDFMFRLTNAELEKVSRSHFVILNNNRGSNIKYLPYAFTEQGIYMLMTVLRGELATRQSRALIRMFKTMKDHIIEKQKQIEYRDNLKLALKAMDSAQDLAKIKSEVTRIDSEVTNINKKLNDVVKRSEISPVILDFSKQKDQNEFLFLNGELAKASETYIDIYAKAEKTIFIIDNYINIKTLRHLQKVKDQAKVVVFSDNLNNYLHRSDYLDFRAEFPHIKIKFLKNQNKIHDRFIVLDFGLENERIFHCGASEKDAGGKLSVICEISKGVVKTILDEILTEMLKNAELDLK